MSGMEKWKNRKISFSDIRKATKEFKNLIGTGGYGSVYEGKLSINGEEIKVAVKRLNEKGGQGLKEFWTEIDLLHDKQHPNIINLVGYCDDENEKIIVYDFAERGSLDFYFKFKDATYALTWLQRLKIVVDVARALDHLHNHLQNNQVIIHRDIKTSNILLDHNWVAKISDFGLSKSIVTGFDRSTIVTYACGTPGYVEPELRHYFTANRKSDVFSFGMLLFEVLCGRLCGVKYEEDEILSAKVAEDYYIKGNLNKNIDPRIIDELNPDALSKFSAIAYKCLLRREQRPLIDVVKKELEETLKIQGFNSGPTPSMSLLKELINLKIPFQDIKDATKDFRKVIGRGDYGSIYEGEVHINNRHVKIAVKRSNLEFGQGIEEFLKEINLHAGRHHRNLIKLFGYCDEGNEKIIVYEYAANGSLDWYIRCRNTNYELTWLQRLRIVVDAAHGLHFLHYIDEVYQTINHRNIQSSNILLDDNWHYKKIKLM